MRELEYDRRGRVVATPEVIAVCGTVMTCVTVFADQTFKTSVVSCVFGIIYLVANRSHELDLPRTAGVTLV